MEAATIIVLAVTALVVAAYTWETRKQAEATRRIAEASLRPALEQYLPDEPPVTPTKLTVMYGNYGNGPAVNIKWTLEPSGSSETRERVGLGIHAKESPVEFTLDGKTTPQRVVAEYDDLYGKRWASILTLEQDNGVLKNGPTTHEARPL